MKELLVPYIGKEVGMNAERPFHLDTYKIEAVADSYFTVSHEKNSNRIHIPFHNIVRIIQDEIEGIHVGGIFQQKRDFQMVIKIGHIVASVPA
jgi:hypothetical protein